MSIDDWAAFYEDKKLTTYKQIYIKCLSLYISYKMFQFTGIISKLFLNPSLVWNYMG